MVARAGSGELGAVRGALRADADPARAATARRFFRAEAGGYGEGDRFLGLTVPQVRAVAREHRDISPETLAALLGSTVHEERFLALVLLVERARRARTPSERDTLARFYLEHLDGVNNWDLVDMSAPHVLGPYFAGRSRAPLRKLARSPVVWHRRIAILTTFFFIRAGDHAETLALARLLRDDEHDLIHKAVGWMLREVGQRDPEVLAEFLEEHAARMPRTMLRYAIEKLPLAKRRRYMVARSAEAEVALDAPWGIRVDDTLVAKYFSGLPLPVRTIARGLDEMVRAQLPGVRVGTKWGVPFYFLRGPVCYISGAKAHLTFGLVQGASIEDGAGALTGTGKSPIRKATFRIGDEIPERDVRAWLKQARRLDLTWGSH